MNTFLPDQIVRIISTNELTTVIKQNGIMVLTDAGNIHNTKLTLVPTTAEETLEIVDNNEIPSETIVEPATDVVEAKVERGSKGKFARSVYDECMAKNLTRKETILILMEKCSWSANTGSTQFQAFKKADKVCK